MTIPATHSAAYAIPGILRVAHKMTAAVREERIIALVCEYYGLSKALLIKKNRLMRRVRARQICSYLLFFYKNPDAGPDHITKTRISELLKKHHSTIVTSIQTVNNEISSPCDCEYKEDLKNLYFLLNTNL